MCDGRWAAERKNNSPFPEKQWGTADFNFPHFCCCKTGQKVLIFLPYFLRVCYGKGRGKSEYSRRWRWKIKQQKNETEIFGKLIFPNFFYSPNRWLYLTALFFPVRSDRLSMTLKRSLFRLSAEYLNAARLEFLITMYTGKTKRKSFDTHRRSGQSNATTN